MAGLRLKAGAGLEVALKKYASRSRCEKAGAKLFSEGDSSDGCYLVMKGKLRLFIPTRKGQPIFEATAEKGCLVGLPATINGNRYSLTCEAATDIEVAYLSRRDIMTLMRERSDAAVMLLDLLSEEVQTARRELAKSSPRLVKTNSVN